MSPTDAQTRQELDDLFAAEDAVIMGEYGDAVKGLLALSRDDLDAITPDTTDIETYNKLIAVVKEASARNRSQAQLKARIMAMGELAIGIAKKVPQLAAFL